MGKKSYFLKGKRARNNVKVRVTGRLVGRELTATSISTTATAAALSDVGTTRVLVMLAYWTAPDGVTPASASSQLFGDTNGWYRDASYTALGQSGDVTPWMPIAAPTTGCYSDTDQLMSEAQSAASSRGYKLANYDNFLLYFPYCGGDAAGFAGWAYVGSPDSWLNGYLDRRVTVHEQGHNYGLLHSHSYMCSGGGLLGSCSFNDYGDLYDAMGSSDNVGHFNAAQKTTLGWLNGRAVNLSSGGTATLVPMAADSTSPHAAYVTKASGRKYWIEYRQPIDFDSLLPTSGTDGVLIHVSGAGSGSPDSAPNLIDVRPSDGISPDTSTLRSGQSWTSPDGDVITVGQVTSAGAHITISTVTAPSLPTSVAVTKSDSAKTATLTWAPPASTGGSAITGYKVARDGVDSTGAGAWSKTVAGTARSQTFGNLKPGTTYHLTVLAINSAGNGPAASVSVTITPNVTVPSVPTSVAVTKSDSAKTATLTWAPPASTGGSAITGYKVARDGVDSTGAGAWSKTVASTARSQTFGNLKAGSAYHLTVLAINSAGNGPAASVTVTMAK